MDTKEMNREQTRKRRAPEEQRRKRPAPEEEPRKKRPADKAPQESAGRKAPAEAAAKAPKRRAPAEAAAEKPRRRASAEAAAEMPKRRAPAEAAAEAPKRRRPAHAPAKQQERAAQSSRRPDRGVRADAVVQHSERPDDMQFSVPKGTGPRKSAPQLSAEETAALRRQQRSQRQQTRTPAKKNALQNFIAGVKGDPSEDAAAKAEQRRKDRAARAEKKRRQAERNDTPAVIYTQPMAFSRDRLLVQLLTVTAVVVAIVLGMSVFFKVKTITVAGAETYSAWAISEASGISEGDSLLTFSKAKASAKIQASLSYVDDVRIGIKLPDTVIIYIEEMDVAYSVESTQGDWWLINSTGRVVEQVTVNEAKNHTQVLGVLLDAPEVGNSAVAANEVPQETLASGEFVPMSVTGEQRLSSALQILKALEANDIVGEAASVDVSDLEDVTLWYGSRYEVLLGTTDRMEYKIACMNDAILELSEYQSGILDISFTYKQDQVVYTPFG